jgi:hypothetical protein
MYTAKHQNNRETIKHTKTNEYYIISHPLRKNITTGKACIRIKDVAKYDKNFIFQYIGNDDKLKTIMIGRKYVCDHLYPCPNNGEINNKGILNSKFFYLINIEDIFTYGKEIEL